MGFPVRLRTRRSLFLAAYGLKAVAQVQCLFPCLPRRPCAVQYSAFRNNRKDRFRSAIMRVKACENFGEETLVTRPTKPLQGIRVLDFSTTIAGPHCTRMLSDMGAEVIKIETAEGETMRTRPPVRGNCSTIFGSYNVGKKSVVLDLKSAA